MSILHSNTTQSTSRPTDEETEHVPIVKKISDKEILVDFSAFKYEKDHYLELVSLYNNNQELVDVVYFKPEDRNSMVIFDLDKINKTEELVKRDDDGFMPRHWNINDEFHAVIKCNIHGNWSDVVEDEL